MQKYLWGGAALLVAGAAACTAGVYYTACHPASFLGRCGAAVAAATTGCRPVETMSVAVTGTPAPAAPSPAPEIENAAPTGNEQTIEPVIEVEPQVESPIGWHNAAESEPVIDFGGLTINIDDGVVPMPYADEDEVKPEADAAWDLGCLLGCEMSDEAFIAFVKKWNLICAATDDSEFGLSIGAQAAPTCGCFVFGAELCDDTDAYRALIKKKVLAAALQAADQGGACEESSDDDLQSMLTIKKILSLYLAEPCEGPAEEAVPSIDEQLHDALGGTMINDDYRTGELIPVMPVEDEEAVESERTEEEMPPANESSYHHYHHSGCPYMGGCPYCPPCYPPQSAVQIPEGQPKDAVEESETIPAKPHKVHKLDKKHTWDSYLRRLGVDRSRPFTDTMECRPSDAPDMWKFIPYSPY
jgi:hypothetical protein